MHKNLKSRAVTLLFVVNCSKIPILQTFLKKYRPFTDPKVPKDLYYRPRSVNTDPLGNPVIKQGGAEHINQKYI